MYRTYLDYVSRNLPFVWAHRLEIPIAFSLLAFLVAAALLFGDSAERFNPKNYTNQEAEAVKQIGYNSSPCTEGDMDCLQRHAAEQDFTRYKVAYFVIIGVVSAIGTAIWFVALSRFTRIGTSKKTYAYPYLWIIILGSIICNSAAFWFSYVFVFNWEVTRRNQGEVYDESVPIFIAAYFIAAVIAFCAAFIKLSHVFSLKMATRMLIAWALTVIAIIMFMSIFLHPSQGLAVKIMAGLVIVATVAPALRRWRPLWICAYLYSWSFFIPLLVLGYLYDYLRLRKVTEVWWPEKSQVAPWLGLLIVISVAILACEICVRWALRRSTKPQ